MEKVKKIIFVQPHPIHWFSPQFEFIEKHGEFDFEVLYCTKHGLNNEVDSGFGINVDFNVDLLKGYNFKFLKNISFYKKHTDKLFSSINLEIFKHFKTNPKGTIFICHGWSRITYLLVFIFAPFYGMQTGLRSEAPLIHENKYSRVIKFLRKIIFKYLLFPRINYFNYIGTQNRLFYNFYGVPHNKLFFLPYCVNNEFFLNEYKKLTKDGFCRQDKSFYQILFVGKLIEKKNPESLIKAFIKLNKKNIKLLIAGDGYLKSILQKKYKKEIESGEIEFLGFQNQDQLCKLYTMSDLFVLPSSYGETWGLVLNEALNFDLPILASSRVGSATDLVLDNGLIFDFEDEIDLYNKLVIMINNKVNFKKNPIIEYDYNTIIKTLSQISKP